MIHVYKPIVCEISHAYETYITRTIIIVSKSSEEILKAAQAKVLFITPKTNMPYRVIRNLLEK